jgi:hypothetical protein
VFDKSVKPINNQFCYHNLVFYKKNPVDKPNVSRPVSLMFCENHPSSIGFSIMDGKTREEETRGRATGLSLIFCSRN